VRGAVLDPAAAAWLRRVLPGHRITAAEPLAGGYRNENIRLVTDGGSYVLRRYLRGDAAQSPAEIGHLQALAAAAADPLARSVARARQLVHSDYNGKNLLAVGGDGRRSVSAVLDWEFAFSGSPLTDIGNMLRFRDSRPRGFADGFVAGYRDAGGQLPERWREISQALDLYALADFLTRPPGHRYFGKAVAALKDRLVRDAPA
jgi:aminoglycoside phosphotransferase (APT) family kinase protein